MTSDAGSGSGSYVSQKPAQCLQISNIVLKNKIYTEYMLFGKGVLGTGP